jgi:tetratricopeptide (TPR) repeat protein
MQALDVVIQVTDALAEAHSQGIIHRDIKPQNVMVTPQSRVKVLDFGLAKMVHRPEVTRAAEQHSVLSMPGVVMGTAPYMSPEQAKGVAVDARSDLFSVGVMLYECIAGYAPFSGETPIETCAQVIQLEPPPPSQLNPFVPAELDAVTLKALAKDPATRYQSAAELLEDLRRISLMPRGDQAGHAIPLKTPPQAPRRLTRLSGSLRRRRVLIPVVILAVPLALVALWNRGSTPSREATAWYRTGIEEIHNGAYYAASRSLEQCVEVDGQFALARARLAEAYVELDYSEKADKEIIRAQRLVAADAKLPELDALHFQAITHVVLRELDAAIDRYHQIVRLAPDNQKAQAYVDLGRAYEMDDQVNKARESYGQATTLAPDDAAAFLRLGMVAIQQNDAAGAMDALQRAETIYRDRGNQEGIAEAHYQRGVLFNNRGELDKARAELEQAFEIAGRDTGNLHQQIRARLELSKSFYTQGQITLAQQYARDAIELARADHRENLTTRGLIEIGKALTVLGHYPEADGYLTQALQYAEENKSRRNEARALMALGALRLTVHDASGGLSHIERALPLYERSGYTRDASLAHYEIGRVRYLAGDYEAAIQGYEQGLDLAEASGDEFHSARLLSAIGYVHADQERYPHANEYFSKSYASYSSLGNPLYTGYEAMNRGNMMWRLGRYEEAREQFAQAESIASHEDRPNMQMVARLSLLKAQMLLSERRIADAKTEASRAFRLYRAIGENAGHEAEVMYTLGITYSLSGATRRGVEMTGQALEQLSSVDHPWMFSGALLAHAEAKLMAGDPREALVNALRAQERLQQAARLDSEWRAWLIAARASSLLSNHAEAVKNASNAAATLALIQSEWGTDAFNHYVTRPDVIGYRSHLDRIQLH